MHTLRKQFEIEKALSIENRKPGHAEETNMKNMRNKKIVV